MVESAVFKNQRFRRLDDAVISLYPRLSGGLPGWLTFSSGHKTYLYWPATLLYRVSSAHFTDKTYSGPDKCLVNRSPEGSSVWFLGENCFLSCGVILVLRGRSFGARLIRKDFAILRELALRAHP